MKFWKIVLIMLLIAYVANGCQSAPKEKAYQYVETTREQSLFGGFDDKVHEPETIMAENDSIAYCEAFEKFCISKKVKKDMKEEFADYDMPTSEPIGFKLISPEGVDITHSVTFSDYEKVKTEIEYDVFSMGSLFAGTMERAEKDRANEFKISAVIDSSTIARLKPGFRINKDEFDAKGRTWYKPRSAPQYVNMNGLYLYFACQQQMPTSLRLTMQYHADEWLFIRYLQFSIDGKPYKYTPMNLERDSGYGGKIWEWFDDPVNFTNTDIVLALYNAKSAKMRLVGDQYHKEKTITSNQLKEIRNTIDLYRAMGGQI